MDFKIDPKGYFRIWIEEGRILCKHKDLTITGNSAKDIITTIIKMNLISTFDHCAYLARELTKAEIALKLGKNYIQDSDLDFGILSSSYLRIPLRRRGSIGERLDKIAKSFFRKNG